MMCVLGDATRLVLLLGKDDQPLLLDGPHTHQWIAQDAQPIIRLVLLGMCGWCDTPCGSCGCCCCCPFGRRTCVRTVGTHWSTSQTLSGHAYGGARPKGRPHSGCCCWWWCGPSLGNAAPHTRGMGLKQDGHSDTVPSYGQRTSTRSTSMGPWWTVVRERWWCCCCCSEVVVVLHVSRWSPRRAMNQYTRCLWFPRVECPDKDHDGRPNRYHSKKKNRATYDHHHQNHHHQYYIGSCWWSREPSNHGGGCECGWYTFCGSVLPLFSTKSIRVYLSHSTASASCMCCCSREPAVNGICPSEIGRYIPLRNDEPIRQTAWTNDFREFSLPSDVPQFW